MADINSPEYKQMQRIVADYTHTRPVYNSADLAEHLLDAGVSPPAAPQERYYVTGHIVRDTHTYGGNDIAKCANAHVAENIASLLNADQRHGGGIVAALDEALQALAGETAQGDRFMRERDEYRAVVESLNAELAETRKYAGAAQPAVGAGPHLTARDVARVLSARTSGCPPLFVNENIAEDLNCILKDAE